MDLQAAIEQLRAQAGLQLDLTQLMLAFALLMARILPVILFTPFLGGDVVPSEVKLGLGLLIGMVIYPALADQVRNVPVSALIFIALMLKELFIGLSMAFVVGIVFDAAQVAGGLIDIMSGTNQAQLMVPQIAQNVSLFANLKVQLVTVVFLMVGGHHVVIAAFADSLQFVSLDAFPRFSRGLWPFFDTIIRVFGDLMRISLALASPVLLATFLTDLALGLVNRVAPQVQVFFVAMQIKPAVTVLVMFAALHVILDRVMVEYGVLFRWLRTVLELLS
ncbi:MAG: flagellar biosynthetic protein FliR [Archangium sp.]|nr:flagellar biosynthetic protein FliR [Archangium sp.]